MSCGGLRKRSERPRRKSRSRGYSPRSRGTAPSRATPTRRRRPHTSATCHARAGTPAGASQNADALLLAVHWSRVEDVLKQAGDVSGKVIVTCSLPMNADDTDLVIAHTSSGAEALAKRVPKARVVSAF